MKTIAETLNDDEVSLSVNELDQILQLQQQIFVQVTQNQNNHEVLQQLCLMTERLLPNSVASVLLKNSESGLLNVFCAPSFSEQERQALEGLQPGENGGSCGNAVYLNQPIYVRDTYTDPRWCDLRQIARDFGLCACWSMPVRDNTQQAIGSFSLTSFEHRSPSTFHMRLLEIGASIVGILLERDASNRELNAQHQRSELLATALTESRDGVVITDAENCIVEANRAFELISGYRLQELAGKQLNSLTSGKHDQAFYQRMWQQLTTTGLWRGEVINQRKDGSEVVQWLSLSLVRDADGEIQNHVAVYTDLTELKASRQRLVSALETDQLTGLSNKTKLGLLVDGSDREQTLLLLNIDNFSYINAAYGMKFGDRFLCTVGQQLQQLNLADQLFRINADEFGLYFDRPVDLLSVVESIRSSFAAQPCLVDQQGFNTTFSYGGAVATQGLLGKAMKARRMARDLGKNHYHLYDLQQDEPAQEQRVDYIRWNRRLYEALKNDRIQPYFQGIRDNRTGKTVKYEALVRLEHDGKIYSPYRFLNAAKLSGLLPTIARRMIDRGLAVIAATDAELSLNITEEDLQQGYLEQYLQQKTEQYGVQPHRLTLEILEGVSASAKNNHIDQLRRLKQQGYRLAIDDFGTEYSNFERIMELNVDYLKIDAKYIKNIVEDATSYEITRAIVFFAKNAGIETVAEFVHNAEVQRVVEQLGIEFSQGYLFHQPGATIPATTR
ncbi:MAG: EAL domain-containing protein [Motiliproteus sp.]